MRVKNIVTMGFAGGAFLFVLLFGLNMAMNLIIPYDIPAFGGMRPMDDPVMLLFFAYPFVLSFAAAWVFDRINDAVTGSGREKGVAFGMLLIVLVALPSNYAMYTSMDWPVSFYIGNLIWAIAGYPLLGILYAMIWRV